MQQFGAGGYRRSSERLRFVGGAITFGQLLERAENVLSLEKDATTLDGYSVSRDRVAESKTGVLNWLKKAGMVR